MILDLPTTVSAALTIGQNALETLSESPGLDSQLLLCEVAGRSRAWILAHPEAALERSQAQAFTGALARCQAGEALPHVLGWWEFFGRRFRLSPAILIPRPETELLVEYALEFLSDRRDNSRAADVGTGSGCIAVSLAAETPALRVIATDLSIEALRIARVNASLHGVTDRVSLVQSDLLAPFAFTFDLLCANLPYIPTETLSDLAVSRRESRLALDGGVDGMAIIQRFLAAIPTLLIVGGRALVEIGSDQGDLALSLVQKTLSAYKVEVRMDLARRNRLLVIDRID